MAVILFANPPEKNTNLVNDVMKLLSVKFCQMRSDVAEEKLEIYQSIRGQDGHVCFPIGPKNTNLVEDFFVLSISGACFYIRNTAFHPCERNCNAHYTLYFRTLQLSFSD